MKLMWGCRLNDELDEKHCNCLRCKRDNSYLLKQHYRFDYNPLAQIDLTSISTVFQSYLDDERLCALKPCTPDPLDQKVSSLPIGLSGLL